LRQREGEILQVAGNFIDFDQMAKTSLGYAWKLQSPDKRREFTRLFKKLLFNTYVDRLEKYGDQEIFYDSQRIYGDLATVRTHVIRNNENVSIEYRLQKQGKQWKVYDVLVEGISYDANYHAQINSILANKSFDALLVILRRKVDRGG
jgi:phospholipid transport system substrate-binding protein